MSENWLRKELESTTLLFGQSSSGALRFVSNFRMSQSVSKSGSAERRGSG